MERNVRREKQRGIDNIVVKDASISDGVTPSTCSIPVPQIGSSSGKNAYA
jgi:hypothetical protein